MIKTVTISILTIIVILLMVLLPWKCRRQMHYNWAYKGQVAEQIEHSNVIKKLESRIERLEAKAGIK